MRRRVMRISIIMMIFAIMSPSTVIFVPESVPCCKRVFRNQTTTVKIDNDVESRASMGSSCVLCARSRAHLCVVCTSSLAFASPGKGAGCV